MKEGWICPRCKTINAPFIGQCTCKPDNKDTLNPASNVSEFNTISKCLNDDDHIWRNYGLTSIGKMYVCEKCGATKYLNLREE